MHTLLHKLRVKKYIINNNISRYNKRTMYTTRNIANKAVNMNLIRNTLVNESVRNMSCVHAGKINSMAPKPKVANTDVSGNHDVVVRTECLQNNCKAVDCANPQDLNANCPSRTAQQNQTSIPPTSQGFTSKIVGNTTGKIPPGKPGFTLNATQNYIGQAKPQHMVEETTPVKIDSNDLNINPQSTAFVQGHKHIIDQNIP